MKKKYSGQVYEFIVVLLLGLTPLLWFHNNNVILGHDAGLPIGTIGHFADRFYAWTARYAFGADQTYAIPGLFIHGIEALVSSFGADLQTEQKITFIFWFVLPGITMFLFARRLEKKLTIPFLALPAAVMYMFNHFTLQGWFIAERTKFSLYAALPLMLLLLFDWKEDRRSTLVTAIFLAFTFFFLNGEASIPLFGGVIVAIMAFIVFYFLDNFNVKSLLKLIQLVAYTLLISIPLQAYWLFSYYDYVKNSYAQSVDFFGGTSGILGWIDYVSQDSSLINLFRLQGVPEWYQNPLHPYAAGFLHNPLLIGISVLIPIAAFIPFILYREKPVIKTLLFLAFLALFSMIFIAGSHPPFGSFYLFFVKFVPGFIAFRTPFYKFSPALWFAYAILISFTISYVLLWIREKNIAFSKFFYGCIIAAIVLYSYPFLNGDFFNYEKNVRSNEIPLPSYILSYAQWANSPERIEKRTLMLPAPNADGKIEAYTWGYWSLAPLSSLYSNASIINDSFYLSSSEKNLLQDIYAKMRKNDPSWIKLAEMLHINSVVMRNDFDWNLKDSLTQSPSAYINALHSSDLKKVKTFGKWDVYDLTNKPQSQITTSKSIQYFDGNSQNIGLLTTIPSYQTNTPLYASSDIADNKERIFSLEKEYYIQPTCIMCKMQWTPINPDQYTPVITRDSIFYKFIKPITPVSATPNAIPNPVTTKTYESYESVLEFSKLIDQQRAQTAILSAGQEYNTQLNELNTNVDQSLSTNDSVADYDNYIEVLSVLRNQRKILTDLIPKINGTYNTYDVYDIIQNGLTKTQLIYDKIAKKINLSMDASTKHFVFDSRKSGKFTLYYKPNEKRNETSTITFSLNGDAIAQKLQLDQNGWYRLDDITIKKGRQSLTAIQPVENIYSASESSSFTIKANARGGCFVSKDIQGEAGNAVHVAFSHKRLTGNEKFFIKFTSHIAVPKYLDAIDTLDSNSVLSKYDNTFILGDNTPHNFLICTKPKASDEALTPSSIELDDFTMYHIPVPDIILAEKGLATSEKNVKSTKMNQTDFVLENNDREPIIILDQSFNQKWQSTFSNATHFVANGFANGWIIDNSNQKGEIYYKPQKLVKTGFITTGVTIIVLVLLLLFIRLRKNDKKK
jgi:hypothetical protein